MDAITEASYAVALQDYPGLSAQERGAAETRYCHALERLLGAPDDVAHLMRAVARVATDPEEPSAEARELLVQWQMAKRAARQAALQGLRDADEAWFDVRLR